MCIRLVKMLLLCICHGDSVIDYARESIMSGIIIFYAQNFLNIHTCVTFVFIINVTCTLYIYTYIHISIVCIIGIKTDSSNQITKRNIYI